MRNLAIKGHTTRGEEVIEILEMLGGKNIVHLTGAFINRIYFINGNVDVDSYRIDSFNYNFQIFTLEEFLKKYPYKVGDWVQHNGATSCDSVFEVKDMKWEDETVKYIVKQLGCCGYGKEIKIAAEYLQPYKETYIKEGEKKSLLASLIEHFQTTPKDELEKEWNEHKELDEISPTVEEYITFAESFKKQIKYPKNYKECCDILGYKASYDLNNITTHDCVYDYKLQMLYRVLICRGAYWKIAGEQMGLNKPWEPDWESFNESKYCLYITENTVHKGVFYADNRILAFPTEEMRDAFYENFKDLIESCKELL